jgi:hypothetical protein
VKKLWRKIKSKYLKVKSIHISILDENDSNGEIIYELFNRYEIKRKFKKYKVKGNQITLEDNSVLKNGVKDLFDR